MTSLAKLEQENIKLNKDKFRLSNLLSERKYKYDILQKQYNYLERTIEEKIKRAVDEFKDTIIKENEELKAENMRLKNLLHNTSINGFPTSKTPVNENKRIPNTREKGTLSKGGQIGHKKHMLERFKDEELTDTYIHKVAKCKCGCTDLKDLGIYKTKDEIEIDIRLQKIRHEFHKYQCLECKKEIISPIPNNLKEDNQYGSNIKALAVSLVNEGFVSFNRTKSLINGFTSGYVNMSEGFMVKLQKQSFNNLTVFNNDLKLKMLNESIIHWDDTVIMIDGQKSCLRFYGNEKLALFTAHETKGKVGIQEDAILSNLKKETTVVHDHLTHNYSEEYEFSNAECCRHLLGDLKELNQDFPRSWCDDLIKLLVDTNKERNEYITNNLSYFEMVYIDLVMSKYDEIVLNAKELNKKDFNKYYGEKERALINRLIKYKANYLMWVLRFDIPFTNNLAERALRPSKTKQKVSGQFANVSNARYFARIRSYIETCKKNGLNVHMAVVRLLEGSPYTLEEILTWKND